jgi:drug/metabolite transporter (DMT)-like permease
MKLTPRLALLMTLPPLLWAGNAVVGRWVAGGLAAGHGAGQVPPLTLNLLRWALTALILLPLAWRALLPLSRLARALALPAGPGRAGGGRCSTRCSTWRSSVRRLSTSRWWRPACRCGCWPWARCSTACTPPTSNCGARRWAFVGVLHGHRPRLARHAAARALRAWRRLFILLAVIGWAFYSWLLARPPAHMQGKQRPDWDWAGFLLVQTLFGLLAASVFTAGEQALGATPIRWSPGVLAALLYVSLGASVVAYRCWGLGVAEGGPAMAAFFNNFTPLFAALLSTLLLGEAPQPYHALAFAFIVAGIVVSAWRRSA